MTREPSVCVITGATRGIGRALADELARRSYALALVGRHPAAGERAVEELRQLGAGSETCFVQADLGVQAQVRGAAQELGVRFPRIAALVNNAGVYALRTRRSADGIELTIAVNHLAPFLLTRLLLPALRSNGSATVLNVTSRVERFAGSGPLLTARGPIRELFGLRAYARSKRAMLHVTRELAHRLDGSGVTVNSVHPGFVATDLMRDLPNVVRKLYEPFLTTPDVAAGTLAELLTSERYRRCNGEHFGPDPRLARTSRASYDPVIRRRVWLESCRLTGLPDELDG